MASFIGTERKSEPRNTHTSPHLMSESTIWSVRHLNVNVYVSVDALYAGILKLKSPLEFVVVSRLKMTP